MYVCLKKDVADRSKRKQNLIIKLNINSLAIYGIVALLCEQGISRLPAVHCQQNCMTRNYIYIYIYIHTYQQVITCQTCAHTFS
jgi:hypothetical protein